MIISASRRTDIPAFYAEWFMNRIREGYFYRVNPFNIKQMKGISLLPEDVDVIVFWTKNAKPILKYLDELDDRGYNYYFQYTLNDYPELIEPNVPCLEERLQTFNDLAQRIGPDKVIWRYDPIIVTQDTPIDYHIEKFNNIMQHLSGRTYRAIISFVDLYGKVNNRWRELNFAKSYKDITKNEYKNELRYLINSLVDITAKHGVKVFTCAEEINLTNFDVQHGGCIDIQFINSIFGIKLNYPKDKSQRIECLCAESIDVGMYSTCKHLCSYCYANRSEKEIEINFKKHNVKSPLLIGDTEEKLEIIRDKKKLPKDEQITLF